MLNSEYRDESGNFDLEQAKKDYSDFLTTVPEKNRIYLQQSLEGVEYQKRKINDSCFGYLPDDDTVYYDTSKQAFWSTDFMAVNTHELSHRIDENFVISKGNIEFHNAILRAKEVIDADPEKYVSFCESLDSDGFLSDILDAISEGNYNFPTSRPKGYWLHPGRKEQEIFANLFCLQTYRDYNKIGFISEQMQEIVSTFDGICP